MGIFDFFGGKRSQQKAQRTPMRPVKAVGRNYSVFEAAEFDRMTAAWYGTRTSIDRDIFLNYVALRARSRDLSYNDPFTRKFLSMLQRNVVGHHGFTLRVTPMDNKGKIDALDKKAIEDAFAKWCTRKNADVTQKLSFTGICMQVMRAVARDGECVIRKVRNPDVNDFGFSLQIVDIDRLDNYKQDERLPNGNILKMGVELTPYGKPVAYWLRRRHPGDYQYSGEADEFERVPADDIYHLFMFERPEQTRGLPWAIASMLRLNHLKSYDEAAVIAARIGAATMGFYKQTDTAAAPDFNADGLADDEDPVDGELLMDAEPGTFRKLPPGYDVQTFKAEYPQNQYASFEKAMLRGIASGLDVDYNTLANDLEGVNFSSIRQGVLDTRDQYKVLQKWFIESMLEDLYEEWLKMALLMKAIKGPTGMPLPIEKFDKFNTATWHGRRWEWVDPAKDATANTEQIAAGLKSRTETANEQGRDIEDVFQQLAHEQELAEQYGITLSSGITPAKGIEEVEGSGSGVQGQDGGQQGDANSKPAAKAPGKGK
jgi:lambda family phage portal protein